MKTFNPFGVSHFRDWLYQNSDSKTELASLTFYEVRLITRATLGGWRTSTWLLTNGKRRRLEDYDIFAYCEDAAEAETRLLEVVPELKGALKLAPLFYVRPAGT